MVFQVKPLSGIAVLDFSRLIPGPFCAKILADLGAKVIKVEDRSFPDYLRFFPPSEKTSPLYSELNQKKKIVFLSLSETAGRKKFEGLVKKSDVVIESFRPGVMDRLGFSWKKLEKINPRLILASITGYGQKGKFSKKAGHDLNYLSMAGLVDPPSISSIQWADLAGGGLFGALQIMTALWQRQKEGKGVHLDVCMTDNMISIGALKRLKMGGETGWSDLLTGKLARYRIYKTSDEKWMALGALEDKFWNRFCDLIGKKEWQSTAGSYADSSPDIHRELEKIFASKKSDEWEADANQNDICLTPVR